ncbi:MFS transporter [Bacillaceae bacterium S4-13-58]
MKEATAEKLNIFMAMFLMNLIMRLQVPVFTPYAAAFGASSFFIGIILSVTAFSNLSGNLLAGPLVDKVGKKMFIILPIYTAGILFIFHGLARSSMDLLLLHALNGFAMGFMIPAAFTLLSSYAKNRQEQGKNMAINGILSTIANILAPLLGGKLVVLIGYVNTYFFMGAAMIMTGFYTVIFLKDRSQITTVSSQKSIDTKTSLSPKLIFTYLIGFAVMYNHGVLIYEIPYLTVEKGYSTYETGKLFSYMGIGTFITLSLLFINRFDPYKRLLVGLFGMSMTLFGLSVSAFSLPLLSLISGLFFGLIMPAMATAITEGTNKNSHGKAFGYMSAIFSIGIILSSFITGAIRSVISPYYIAFSDHPTSSV